MTTLNALRARIRESLMDTSDLTWTDGAVDEALRAALRDFNAAKPRFLATLLTVSADTYELDVSAVSGLLAVERVWLPYTASSPEFPPAERRFEFWDDQNLIRLLDYQAVAGEVARIFYTTPHTILNLDDASATTVSTENMVVLMVGATAYAALSRALDLTEQTTQNKETPDRIREWGNEQLARFNNMLWQIRRPRSSAFVSLLPVDRYKGAWT